MRIVRRKCGVRSRRCVFPIEGQFGDLFGFARKGRIRAALRNSGENAWSEGRRGAGKELRVPGSRDHKRLDHDDAALDLNKKDESGGDDNGNRRVHADTERAMIGIGIDRVRVRDLRDGKQRQQNQTHHGDRRQSRDLCASISYPMCRKCCQKEDPHLKNTQV